MRTRTLLKAPAMALVAALGVTMVSGDAAAQQEQQQQQQEDQPQAMEQCRAILSPSTLTAPSAGMQMEGQERQQQRIAGKMTLQARLSEDIGKVTEVRVEGGSNLQVSLAQEEQTQDEARRHEEMMGEQEQQQEEEQEYEREGEEQQQYEQQGQEERTQQRLTEMSQNRIPIEVDVSNAEEGEYTVTFVGENNRQCTGTLRVRTQDPGR